MHLLIYLFLIITVTSCAPAPAPEKLRLPEGAGQLIVKISGLRNHTGELFVSLFSGREGFPDDPDMALINRHQPITGDSGNIVFDDLPYGDYAISLLHDENLDGRMNTSIVGAPREGFGFSGNPKSKMGPPEYDETRFLLLIPEKKMNIVVQYETVGRERQRIMQERKSTGAESKSD